MIVPCAASPTQLIRRVCRLLDFLLSKESCDCGTAAARSLLGRCSAAPSRPKGGWIVFPRGFPRPFQVGQEFSGEKGEPRRSPRPYDGTSLGPSNPLFFLFCLSSCHECTCPGTQNMIEEDLRLCFGTRVNGRVTPIHSFILNLNKPYILPNRICPHYSLFEPRGGWGGVGGPRA